MAFGAPKTEIHQWNIRGSAVVVRGQCQTRRSEAVVVVDVLEQMSTSKDLNAKVTEDDLGSKINSTPHFSAN